MSIQAVIQLIEQLGEIHSSLLDLALEKKQALISNDVNQLNQIVTKENQAVRKVAVLEQQRTEAVDQFLVSKCYRPNPNVTITDLIQLIYKAEEKEALRKSRDQLFETLSKLKQANELNQQLIRQSLAFIDYSLNVFMGSGDDDAVYQNPAQANGYGYKRSGLFDTRA